MVHRDCVAFAIPQVVHHLTFFADDSHPDRDHRMCVALEIVELLLLGFVLRAEDGTVRLADPASLGVRVIGRARSNDTVSLPDSRQMFRDLNLKVCDHPSQR